MFYGRQVVLQTASMLTIGISAWVTHGELILYNFDKIHWEDELFWQHHDEKIKSFVDCWRYPLWPGLYRPITTTCYYYVVEQVAQRGVEIYHVINAFLYLANGLLLAVYSRFLMPWGWGIVAAAVFVSRVAHSELLANTVEFQALFAVFLTLTALIAFEQGQRVEDWRKIGWQLLAALALLLALLSKEMVVTTPALMILAGVWGLHRWNFRSYCPPLLVASMWALFFFTSLRHLSGQSNTGFSFASGPTEIFSNYAVYFLGFLNGLAFDAENRILPVRLATLANEPIVLLGIALICVFPFMVWALSALRRAPLSVDLQRLCFAIGFFVVATAPFVILADRTFLRYSYWGHAGLAIAFACLLHWVSRRLWPKFQQISSSHRVF